MRRCILRLGFQEVNAVWRQTLQDRHLRSLGTWEGLPDLQVGQHLVGVASLESWWRTVASELPLVASPIAERAICEVRRHLTRLLAQNPAALPADTDAHGRLLRLATALSAQAQHSEHAYLLSDDELCWARALSQSHAADWQEVAQALMLSFPLASHEDHSRERMHGEDPELPGIVQRFYERDPIPRWEDLADWGDLKLLPEPIRLAGEAGRPVLVAGCGTGRWACQFASAFPRTPVLGVDISRTSLKFAQERSRRLALTNIEFEQADLRSWSSQRRFDFIECSGVLHHLEDPQAAWRHLLGMLGDEGVMLVALYSRLARRPLKDLKQSILAKMMGQVPPLGWAPDDDVLRRFRYELIAMIWASPLMQLARSPDLHSLSRLRDAFFNPLEHEYNLMEVQAMLDDLGIRLAMPFAFDDTELQKLFFHCRPAQDVNNLAAWHELEKKMPELFIGMYELYVKKK